MGALCVETNGLGSGSKDGTEPLGAAAVAGAHTCMVTKSVGHTVIHGAGLVEVSDRESEPHAHHEFEERPRYAQFQRFGGRVMKSCTGTWFL